ncbi:unnamed protein product [Vitrella brassicaformis CCMP3155]|uniref:Uncharacterized protein n=1 Tax=Vitrella brassicaformis (strain CCMP3155) TaxID=1169540 RepID=A0A0G4G5V8_VITBC|nr:unnamed protein product [Vitrella brassicaformis CCMP3155]|eukprot:CEM23777.1 unnamed protein product [Vitrella brassicaformis CCMP3155]
MTGWRCEASVRVPRCCQSHAINSVRSFASPEDILVVAFLLSTDLSAALGMASGSAEGQQSVDCLRLEDIDIGYWADKTSEATRQLAEGIIRRTFSDAQKVTDLIHNGADPNHQVRLRMLSGEECSCGSRHRFRTGRHRLVSLAIDNSNGSAVPTVDFGFVHGRRCALTLPYWSSPELEAAILNALIDGGADINEPAYSDDRPIKMAIRLGNEEALRVLLARDAALRHPHGPSLVLALPTPPISDRIQVSPAYEERLLSIYRRLIQHDPTLATEQDPEFGNLIHVAAQHELGFYSQRAIDAYLELLVDNGADTMAANRRGSTALHEAAYWGSPCVADYLGRHVAPADIDRGTTDDPNRTPLFLAAISLAGAIERSQDDDSPQDSRDQASSEIPLREATIRSLLRSGADISRIPTATEQDRRYRELCAG